MRSFFGDFGRCAAWVVLPFGESSAEMCRRLPVCVIFDFMILKTDRRAMFMANRSAVR